MTGDLGRTWSGADELRRLLPVFALVIAVIAAIVDPSSAVNLALAAVPVLAFEVWAVRPNVPLLVISVAVIVPVVVAQRSGELEPLFFEISMLAFVVARWAPSLTAAVVLGSAAVASPVLVSLLQDPSEIAVGIWIVGIAFPWALGLAVARQGRLAAALEAARRELADQALSSERRRIARDVHDFVGHGLAAVMLQVTSARHVLRRDPDSAEEALRAAEEVGRRSMQELRRTVVLLRSDEEEGAVLPPLPSATDIPRLVDQTRAGGVTVEWRVRGDLAQVSPGVGVALYRIAQEALANAARHAPHARTTLRLEVANGEARLVAETNGSTAVRTTVEPERPRFGLVGMRERAAALGGELVARADGRRLAGELPAADAGGRGAGDAVIRVALVDDQAIVRTGLARILSPVDGFEVVAECGDGRQAVEELPALRPDVVLMDIRMPILDGIAATAQLRASRDPLDILVLTTFGEDEVLWGAIEAGAAGFVLKDSSAEDLIAAVRAVAGGAAWFDAAVASRLLERYREVVAPSARDAGKIELLSEREHDVLRLMARGATNAEIAGALHVAEATVKTHVGSILRKLRVRDRAAAIVFAYDHGVVTPGARPS
jgi:DNA-binding NarL/FixJ family response regulator/signal transduction histidine kinase